MAAITLQASATTLMQELTRRPLNESNNGKSTSLASLAATKEVFGFHNAADGRKRHAGEAALTEQRQQAKAPHLQAPSTNLALFPTACPLPSYQGSLVAPQPAVTMSSLPAGASWSATQASATVGVLTGAPTLTQSSQSSMLPASQLPSVSSSLAPSSTQPAPPLSAPVQPAIPSVAPPTQSSTLSSSLSAPETQAPALSSAAPATPASALAVLASVPPITYPALSLPPVTQAPSTSADLMTLLLNLTSKQPPPSHTHPQGNKALPLQPQQEQPPALPANIAAMLMQSPDLQQLHSAQRLQQPSRRTASHTQGAGTFAATRTSPAAIKEKNTPPLPTFSDHKLRSTLRAKPTPERISHLLNFLRQPAPSLPAKNPVGRPRKSMLPGRPSSTPAPPLSALPSLPPWMHNLVQPEGQELLQQLHEQYKGQQPPYVQGVDGGGSSKKLSNSSRIEGPSLGLEAATAAVPQQHRRKKFVPARAAV